MIYIHHAMLIHYAYTYSVRGEAEAEELSRLEQELMRDSDVFHTPSAR